MLEFTQGDIFDADADIRVNTVNCVGVMGAGVALAFKQRYPEMFKEYQRECKDGRVKPGRMHVWKSLSGDCIVNFPTKRDWREPSRYEDIDAGLDDLRGYLDTVGPLKVTLPALGCGHGGLDWARVSGMIRDKLDGVDAHVLVFEPAASLKAGRAAVEAPTDGEREGAAKLGYQLVTRESLPTLDSSMLIHVLGKQDLLSRKWIALLTSRAPAEREVQALRAIAAELARSKNGAAVALVHGSHASEEVAHLFASQGIDVVLMLPFGVLTRKSIAKHSAMHGSRSPTLASVAPASAKWSRQLFAQTMDVLRTNAAAMLLSDPEPDWLTSKGLGKWEHIPMSYVRYETTPHGMREALANVGAKPIGRRGEDGAPNIDHLSSSWKRGATTDDAESKALPEPEQAELTPEVAAPSNGLAGGNVLTVSLGDLSEVTMQEVFDVLLRIDARRLNVTVTLPDDVSNADLSRLMGLGFSQQKHS
jgi:O-acetyl-ADP-ribose deacetylase (regulator of RNase III)